MNIYTFIKFTNNNFFTDVLNSRSNSAILPLGKTFDEVFVKMHNLGGDEKHRFDRQKTVQLKSVGIKPSNDSDRRYWILIDQKKLVKNESE